MTIVTDKQLRASSATDTEYLAKLRAFFVENPGAELPGTLKPPASREIQRDSTPKQAANEGQTTQKQKKRRARRVKFPPFPSDASKWVQNQYNLTRRLYDLLHQWCEFIPGWYAAIKTDRDYERLSCYLAHKNGARVRVTVPYNAKERIEFGPLWPVDCGGRSIMPESKNRPSSITISQNRSPSAAAADLERRLLVHVAGHWVDLQSKIEESSEKLERYRSRYWFWRRRLVNLSQRQGGNGRVYENSGAKMHCGSASVNIGNECYYTDIQTVTLEFDNLSQSDALKLWSYYRELRQRDENEKTN